MTDDKHRPRMRPSQLLHAFQPMTTGAANDAPDLSFMPIPELIVMRNECKKHDYEPSNAAFVRHIDDELRRREQLSAKKDSNP